MLGDLRVLDLGDELLLSCERAGLQELFNMIRRYKLGARRRAAQADGRDGRAVADRPRGAPRRGRRRAAARRARQPARGASAGTPVVLVATDLGVDVFCDAASTEGVRAALLAAGATEVTEAAAELVRVESGRPRYGIDLDDSVIPQEAGLNERAVSFTKGCYVGQETVARLFYRGKPNRHLRGLQAQRAGRAGHAAAARREGGRPRRERRRLPRPRPDRPRARAPRGRARRHADGRRRRGHRGGRRAAVRRSRVTLIAHSDNGSRVGSDPFREGAADGRTRARPRQRHRQLG